MRVIILGIADDVRQADQVLRALEQGGSTIVDVTALLVCADERALAQCPVVGMNLPAPIQPDADSSEPADAGFISVTSQATFQGVVVVAAPEDRLGQRPSTITLNSCIELPSPAGVAEDLQALGIPLPEARQIAAVVRAQNVLLLVDESPGRPADAIIDCMFAEGLSKVFMVTVAVAQERDAARQVDGYSTRQRVDGDRPPPTWRWNQLYF
jgi:hypothetical protein